MTTPVGFGVIGAKSYVANAAVMPAIDAATNATLVATASRSGRVDPRWASTQLVDYDAVLQHPGVDVVYIPLPNGMHREWTERAAAAGKHVLCEKPLAAEPGAARAMAEADVKGTIEPGKYADMVYQLVGQINTDLVIDGSFIAIMRPVMLIADIGQEILGKERAIDKIQVKFSVISSGAIGKPGNEIYIVDYELR